MKKFLEVLLTIVCALAILLGVVSLLARSPIATAIPVLRGTTPMVVLSGSMEPKIHTGALVFVRPVDIHGIAVGDVIAFNTPKPWGDERELTTHRVIGITHDADGALVFKTKGDANGSPDPWTVPARSVTGLAAASLPYFGYLSVFVRSWLGFVLLIVVPALLIVGSEVIALFEEVRREREARKPQAPQFDDSDFYEVV